MFSKMKLESRTNEQRKVKLARFLLLIKAIDEEVWTDMINFVNRRNIRPLGTFPMKVKK